MVMAIYYLFSFFLRFKMRTPSVIQIGYMAMRRVEIASIKPVVFTDSNFHGIVDNVEELEASTLISN